MRRARDPEQKAAKREKILTAAAHCYINNGHKLPSALEVAKEANVAKGTVYLYFKTKEEIFLALYTHLLHQLLSGFNELTTSEPIANQLSKQIDRFVEHEPEFLPLAAMLQSVLETNLEERTLASFKRSLSEELRQTGELIDRQFNYAEGFSERALIHSYAGLVGLWQMLQWPKALSDSQDDEVFKPLRRNLSTEMNHLLQRIWQAPVAMI